MANKMSIVSQVDKDIIDVMMPELTEPQRNAIINFGAQMYHDGWSEWGPRFFFAGMVVGVASIAAPLVADKLKKQKTSGE